MIVQEDAAPRHRALKLLYLVLFKLYPKYEDVCPILMHLRTSKLPTTDDNGAYTVATLEFLWT